MRIIIHCSDSLGANVGFGDAHDIDIWHVRRGFSGVGYHYIIGNGKVRTRGGPYDPRYDGHLWKGRDEWRAGAHVRGHNDGTIGVCLIGRGEYTPNQWATCLALVAGLCAKYGIGASSVVGHCELDADKGCPLTDMQDFRARTARILKSLASELSC